MEGQKAMHSAAGCAAIKETQVVHLPSFIQITGAGKFSAGPGDSEAAKACDLHSWMQQSDPRTFTFTSDTD